MNRNWWHHPTVIGGTNRTVISIHGQRSRIPCEIKITEKDWDQSKQIIKNPKLKDLNLLINNIKSQINAIEIKFRLSGEVLTVEKCATLLKRPDLSINFIAFMEYELALKVMESNSVKNHESVLKKLKEYKPIIHFADLTETFINRYRQSNIIGEMGLIKDIKSNHDELK